MAAFKFSCCYSVSRRYFFQILNKNKQYSTICILATPANVKFKCNESFVSKLRINKLGLLRNTVYEAFYSSKSADKKPLNLESLVDYENVAEETLQSIYERFEDHLQNSNFGDWDANYSNGVLTITLEENRVYVINKQTPNRQIWLSSPVSGPKRYDYINGTWIYKHNGISLHQLLTGELSQLLEKYVDFSTCSYGS